MKPRHVFFLNFLLLGLLKKYPVVALRLVARVVMIVLMLKGKVIIVMRKVSISKVAVINMVILLIRVPIVRIINVMGLLFIIIMV